MFTPFTTNAGPETKPAGSSFNPNSCAGSLSFRISATTTTRVSDRSTTWRVAPAFIDPMGPRHKLKANIRHGLQGADLTELYVNFPAFKFSRQSQPRDRKPHRIPTSASNKHCCTDPPSVSARPISTTTSQNLIVGTFDPNTFISFLCQCRQGNDTKASKRSPAGIISDRVRLRADYTYTEARDDTTGLALLRRPVNKASVSAVWSPIDKLTVTTTLLYVSPLGRCVDRSTFVRIVQPGYELARVAAEYSVTNNWTLFGRIENLFNVQYDGSGGLSSSGLRHLWRCTI